MAYVGNQPVPQATQTRDRFVATSGQTSFATSGYTPNFVDVYLDGVKLDSSEYTATNGSDVVLGSGASTGQIMEVVAFSSFDVADIRNMTQPLGLKNYTTTERNALTGIGAGDTVFNSTVGSIQFYDGTNWVSTNLIPNITSVTGNIYAGEASVLAVAATNNTDAVTIRFTENGTTIANVITTMTSGSGSVTVPSSVYNQSDGDTISITLINEDGTPSSNSIPKNVVGTPTGGTIISSGGYKYHKFTSSTNLVIPSSFPTTTIEYVIIAGGAGGSGDLAGGGGAGGHITGTFSSSAATLTVTVGAGGAASGSSRQSNTHATNGSNSVLGSLTPAIGGGRGGSYWNGTIANEVGQSGGSGGGGGASDSDARAGGSGTSGQGNAGGTGAYSPSYGGGGGGGAGAVGQTAISGAGQNGGNGGVGTASYSTFGAAVSLGENSGGTYYFCGGGGGGSYGQVTSTRASSGLGGGGRGGIGSNVVAEAATANTGGGGGAGGYGDASVTGSEQPGATGGSGAIIIRYQLT